ncbi:MULTISPECIES: bifunctional riboflavin kinase/FAD synthetase [unclassified Colwellia]|uniref:bifunctional riboflavin kinase/FAD synthetase n=1 Tax=unclassified Colwellia TaxID=196834 RepID=UPI0015F41EF9|nr:MULTISPECIES: bifunctional riboflavin kinase/FAD synthetase [unclassified Colwellia]MBA6232397.1 bifunctional riboflavin kinase/FAD synthetase [Colwellia sp. MB02u-7]MBA6238254.1 bifunctional riboflavin kinase/FAD synthetase [Colwellia sp. MB02u-11]MBA6254532.1 bifunctional riboflavin kinase/FAD synthetase [Colwellia sp. MB3u-28]MBA6258297.1 bifunctional riboflavin kinase/FAD synthetase [Colwellia sp. MB3u-41]MBA6301004.1 bifunctional riboflavin kinase/FAD synthetase [Colwellia sp. MB3u-22]
MQLIRGIHNIQAEDHGCVLTIGNFDGVHLGHARVIKALIEKAKALNCSPAVMIFEPQPQELFSPNTAPARLTRLRDKYFLLKNLGVQRLICVNFHREFARKSASEFIEQLLVKQLGIKHLIIGDDFRFGKNRLGDFSLLKQAGEKFDFTVSDTASFKLEDSRISSTKIRKALENNELADVEEMLGRAYSIIGRVFHGDKRGRQLGFPTANVLLKRRVSPISGVFVVKVNTVEDCFYGVANIGSRPTVAGIRQQLEVHIFNFNKDIYGQTIEVVMLKKLRNEIKFSSLDELTMQISQDSEQAKAFVQNL